MRVHTITRVLVACLATAFAGGQSRAADTPAVDEIAAVLDEFNRAASDADADAYFGCLAPDAVMLGTAAEERWTVDELRVFMRPYFDQDRGRGHTPRDRHITLCAGEEVAFFDEVVEMESLGDCRGTGVVIKLDEAWRIAQYSLSIPIPNEIVYEVIDSIREHGEREQAQTSDEASIRAVLESYLAGATYPDPAPIDPEIFADDVQALWSNGKTYSGRDTLVSELERSKRELGDSFESFKAEAKDVRMLGRAGVAVVTCRIEMRGTLLEGQKPFASAIRTTLVFERQGGRWRIAHEHSNSVPAEG